MTDNKQSPDVFSYWIHAPGCTDTRDGYISQGKRPTGARRTKINRGEVPSDSVVEVLFKGTKEECIQYNSSLRPSAGMGWNTRDYRGGGKMSDETKEKLRNAYANRSPEGKAYLARKISEGHADKTPDEREAMYAKHGETLKEAFALRTPEWQAEITRRQTASIRATWAGRTEAQRKAHGEAIRLGKEKKEKAEQAENNV